MYIYVVSIALTLSVNKTDWCLFYASHTQTTNIDFFFSHTATDFLMLIIYLDHSGKLSGDLVIKNEEGSLTVPSLWGFFSSRMLQDRGLSTQPGLLERVQELKETHCSPYLLAFLFDCYEDALENSTEEEQKGTLEMALEVGAEEVKAL